MQATSTPGSGARAVAVYTAARAALFAAVLVLLALLGFRGLVLLLAALVASGILSYVLLAPQRIAVARTVETRLERPRRSRLRDRLDAATGARVLACDFSLGMLTEGARRRGGASVGGVSLLAGDALALPFRDAVFDAVTISFGLRNVSDLRAALMEMRRVTKPGGRLVVCEFSLPTSRPFRTVYAEYLMRALPPVARAVSSNPEAYVYLAESIRAWPDQRALAGRIAAAGWGSVGWRNHSGGIVAVHTGRRPGGPLPAPSSGRRHRQDKA